MEILTAVGQFLRDGGWLAVLIVILFSGYKGWWRWDREVIERDKRIERLETLLDRGTGLAEEAVEVARTTSRSRRS